MRSLIVATVLLAAVANAFVDFNALSGEHKRSVHPETGNIHYEHDVHHHFGDGESKTFFKAKYAAEHEAHWNIIQLHEHIEGMEGVGCGKGRDGEVDRLVIAKPSAGLVTKVHEQKSSGYSHTVITAAAKHQCHGKGVFRRLSGVEEHKDGSMTLIVKAISYNHVFKNLDLHIETNHVHQNGHSVVDGNWDGPKALPPKPDAEAERRMSVQSMWGDVSSACSSTVSDASSACKDASDAVGDAEAAGKDLTAAAGGVMSDMTSFNVDHTFQFKNFDYNGDVTKSFSAYSAATATGSVASSFSFTPTVTVKLVIKSFHLSNFETYFTGAVAAGITGTFDATVHKVWTSRKLVTTLYVDAITFAIGPVPVWLTPSVPLYAGFTATVDGSLHIKAVLSAKGQMSLGYAYAPSTGHRLINTHDLSFSHDFGPLTYSADLGIQAYVEPVLACELESIAKVMIGITIQGDATVQSNNDCALDLNFAVQPTVALNADIDAALMGHTILSKKFGPWSLYSTKKQLYSYCKPQTAAAKALMAEHKGAGIYDRKMLAQSAAAETTGSPKVTTTIEKKLTPRHIGKTWSGDSASLQNGHMVQMEYGVQFSVGKKVNSSRLYMTLVKTQTSPGQPASYSGLITAVASMVYEADQMPISGKSLVYTLVSTKNQSYLAHSNATVLSIKPSKTMTWTVDVDNIRFVQMEADMVYGSISLLSPETNDDDSSFNIFKNGGGVMKVAGMDLNKTDILTILIYCLIATIVIVTAVVLACVYRRKVRTTRRSMEVQLAKGADTGLIQDDQNADMVPVNMQA